MRAEPVLAVCLCLVAASAGAVPLQFAVQGRLVDGNGVNRDGTFDITARLWTAPSGGTLLYQQANAAVPVVNGNFMLLVGGAAGQPALDQVFTGAPVYLEFQAGSETPMTPRQPVLSVPYAVRAGVSDALAVPTPPYLKRGLSVVVSPASVLVKADAVSVGNGGFTDIAITKGVSGLAASTWHSISLVTDAAGSYVDVCVVPGLLAAADAGTRCRAGATAARRVGWAYAQADGTLRAAFSAGDWWNYDVAWDGLQVFAGIGDTFQTFSLAGLLPPTSRRADVIVAGHTNGVPLGPVWKAAGGAAERQEVWNTDGFTTNAVVVTDANRNLDARTHRGFAAMWVVSYYDPE